MAASRKEYELLFKLTAALGGNFQSTFNSALGSTKSLTTTMQKLNSVSGKIDSFKKQSDALQTNKTRLAELSRETEELNRKKASGEITEKQYTAAIQKNETAINKVTEKINQQETSLDKLERELKEANVDTGNLTAENDKLKQSYEAISKSQESLAKINQRISENKAAISATKTELLKTTAVITATGAAFYKAFITPAAEFQSEMSNLGAITGASNEEISLMAEGIRDISKITGTPLMELAANAKMVAEAGGDVNLVMAQMTHGTNLANATQSDMATTLDFLGSQMKTFNLESESTKAVVDSFSYVTTLANLELQQLGDAYVNVGGSAAQAGMSIDDVNALMVVFSNAGLKGGAAGTSLNAVLKNLSTPTAKAATALKELNVSLYDSTGASRDMFDIMADLEGSLGKLTDEQRNYYQNIIFDSVAQKGWNMITADGIGSITELRDEIADSANAFNGLGQAAGMAGTQTDNLTGDTSKAKTAWHDLSITIGDIFIPYVRTATQHIAEIINKIGDFAKENPQLVKTLAAVAGGLATAKVGALAGKLGFLELNGGVLDVVKGLLGFKAKTAQAAAEAITGGGKIATLGKSLSGYFSGVKNSIGGVGNSIDSLAGGKLSGLFSKIGGGLQSGILKPLGGIGSKITGALGGAGSKITGLFGGIGSKIANGPLGKLGGVFKSLGSTVGSVLGGPLKGLGSMFGGLFGKAMPIIMIISALSMLFLKLSGEDISSFIEPLKQAFEDIKPTLQAVMEQFKELGKQLLPLLMDTAKKLAPLLGQIVTGILPVIMELIGQIVPLIIQLVSQLLPVILNLIGELAPILTQVITSILPVIVDLIKMLLPIITQLVTTVLPIIVDVLNKILPIVMQLIQAVLPVLMSILQALMPVIEVLANVFSSVLGAALKAITPILDGLIQILKGIIDFVTGIFTGNWTQAWEGIKEIFGGVFSSLLELVKAPFRVIVGVINGVIGGLNKLKIPDWVPLIGGKGINIPLIPEFAKGAEYTPDTFIAGERGAELVTGASGRKVFTAMETGRIFNNMRLAGAAANSRGGTPTTAPTLASTEGRGGARIDFNPQYHITISGDKPDDLEEQLRKHDEKLLAEFEARLREREQKERRMAYA
jgi:TP901 family phage tail tape measure protein